MKKKILLIFLVTFLLVSISFASAENTCKRDSGDGCTITITMKIAFSGTDNATIENWVKDIEDMWQGTYGDCKCKVEVKVEWKNVANCQNNKASTLEGYHCINVSNSSHVSFGGNNYRGFMWGISKNGSSIAGWWGTSINQPLPGTEGTIHDAAHEAGHMLGLEDEYNASTNTYLNNIMGRTWGNVTPTQEQINNVVKKNCKEDNAKCPNECCCGNGKIEKDKGEECEKDDDCKEEEGMPMCLACKCYYVPVCGDGKITGDEECDPEADPVGCDEGYTCSDTCICKEIELNIRITDPDDEEEFTLDDTIKVKVDIENGTAITKVKYYIDDELQETIEEEPWEWEFLAADYGPGDHEIKATVYDDADNKDSDSVDITIS